MLCLTAVVPGFSPATKMQPAACPIGAWTAVSPANSWSNDGIRSIIVPHLPLPPPPADSPGAGTSGSAETLESNARDGSGLPDGVEVSIESLILHERVGEGTQSEVLLAELPGSRELVAVKLGLKHGAVAREAPVLKAMAGTPGFPKLLHHEADGPLAPGGYLVMELLGPSLDDLRKGESLSESPCLSGPTFLRVGRGVIGLLRELHLAGFVHNDVKPANVLLGKGAEVEPRRLHLIDFGSCTSRRLQRGPRGGRRIGLAGQRPDRHAAVRERRGGRGQQADAPGR